MKRVVIVASGQSYRTGDFVGAAELLQLEPIVATDVAPPLGGAQVQIDLSDPAAASEVIGALDPPPDAVVAIDDQGVGVAARAAADLGLEHNPIEAVSATRDKLLMRRLLEAAAVSQPRFAPVTAGSGPSVAAELGFPMVLKPTGLSASRGVIRADDPAAARRAETRIRTMLKEAGWDPDQQLLAEEYLPGTELVVEGLLVDGALEVLALIDKPDPMEGPFFEETILVTPSRQVASAQQAAISLARDGAAGLGLRSGPIHAEVRVSPAGEVRLLEVAARSIGGLCGRALSFGLLGESLEVLVLRGALGMPTMDTRPARPATGVLMLPIPATGILDGIDGLDHVRNLDGVDDVTLTITPGKRVVALPEGDRYLGFVFAGGADAESVEDTLRHAAALLSVVVDGEAVPVAPGR
ncbi:MAG: ATP-grasp domain-containing protein [Acidimicrobiia bacterium]|nr:ATP-grasp domain-containing protein [Acidimicrobiia bacterium]